MDVNSVMNTYSMSSLWSSLNPSNSSTSSTTPLIDNVDSNVQQNYTSMNYFGQSTNTELQDIYKQIEPSYGMPVTYDENGNFTMPTSTTPPTNGLSPDESNIISLLNSGSSTSDNLSQSLMSQYNSIENGTFSSSLSSILSSNPYEVYNSVDSLGMDQSQGSSSVIDTTA